jgi:hypothetical protein
MELAEAELQPGTLAAVAALVVVVTAAASYVPMRRATRVDPAFVLRAEWPFAVDSAIGDRPRVKSFLWLSQRIPEDWGRPSRRP